MKARTLILLTVILAFLVPTASTAQFFLSQMLNKVSGFSERYWDYSRKPPVETIMFLWQPAIDPYDTWALWLQAQCNIDRKKAKKNRVVFENISLLGVDSDNAVGAEVVSARIKKGKGKRITWDLEPVMHNFATDSAIVVTLQARVVKTLKRLDTIQCEATVLELYDVFGYSTTSDRVQLRIEELVAPVEQVHKTFEIPK
jgi:hypothetical protein